MGKKTKIVRFYLATEDGENEFPVELEHDEDPPEGYSTIYETTRATFDLWIAVIEAYNCLQDGFRKMGTE